MFENLEKVCQVGKNLRVPLIGYIGWSVPGTNPNAYKLSNPKPNQKLTFSMPENTDWDSTWKDSVNMTKHFLRIVKSYGMKLSVEPHFNNIPQSNEQFIALKNEINDSALGCSFDTCWTSVQAAYPPLMVKMLGKHIDNVQFRDTDAETRNAFVPFGEGVIDFEAVVRTLKSMNYQGYITLEEVFLKPDVALVDAKNFLLFMKKVLEN
jgi:sugar phosphate isomerase/epimerase